MKVDLSSVSTKELVEELKTREGVETESVEPYKNKRITFNGPVIILMVDD